MEMTHDGLHRNGDVSLDYHGETANERWQGYYGGERLWGRAVFQLSTPGMPTADSDCIMQLKSKVQRASSHTQMSVKHLKEPPSHPISCGKDTVQE